MKKLLVIMSTIFVMANFYSPAFAHTESTKTTPSSGETVAAGVIDLAVTFSDKVLNLAESSEIALSGEPDSVFGVGCVTVKDKSIQANAFVGTPGKYTATWRTVAEDGHPINGKFSFTVTGTSEGSPLTCENGQTVEVNLDDADVEDPLPQTTDTNSAEAGEQSIYNYLIGGALLAVAVVVFILVRKNRASK